jgi:hypothetical protein
MGARRRFRSRPQLTSGTNILQNSVFFDARRNWADANGIHGYINMPGPGAVQTMRLGARELATKKNREVAR